MSVRKHYDTRHSRRTAAGHRTGSELVRGLVRANHSRDEERVLLIPGKKTENKDSNGPQIQ